MADRNRPNVVWNEMYLEGITAISLSVYHLHDLLMDGFSGLVSITPVVASTDTRFADVEVLGVIDVFVWARLDALDNAGF